MISNSIINMMFSMTSMTEGNKVSKSIVRFVMVFMMNYSLFFTRYIFKAFFARKFIPFEDFKT